MRATNKRRRLRLTATAVTLGVALTAGIGLSAQADASTIQTRSASGEPEIDQAETTSVVPPTAKANDILIVRDEGITDANGQVRTTLYRVVETRDLSAPFRYTLEGAVGGAVGGAGIAKLSSGDGGATLLSIPAAALGGFGGGVGGLFNGLGEAIFNPTKGVTLVRENDGVRFDTAKNSEYVLHGHYNSSTGIVEPIDLDFQP